MSKTPASTCIVSSALPLAKRPSHRTLVSALLPLVLLGSAGHAQVHVDKPAAQAAMVSAAPMAMQQAMPSSGGNPASAVPAATGGAAALSPVSQEWTEQLNHIVSDPPPPHLVRGTHYVISNEDRHDLWLKTIANKGGAYIGVGTDQNYVLAGWQRPELMVLFDFDQVVVNVHYVYRVFFIHSKDPEEFKGLWEAKNEATALKLLGDAYPHPKQRAAILEAYKMSRASVLSRFRKVASIYKIHNIRWFLDDQGQFDYIAQLFRTGRVVMVRGDLTVGTSLSSIASAISAIGMKLSVLYLSNAERYFTYSEGFKKSMLSLPYGDDAVVIRTRARPNGVYMYVVQDAKNYVDWVKHPKVNTVYQLTHQMDADPNPGLFYIRKTASAAVPSVAHPPFAHLKSK